MDSQRPPLLPLTGHTEVVAPPRQPGLSVKHTSCLPNRAGFAGVQHLQGHVAHA